MTGILNETILSLAQAARQLPKLRADRPVHPSTLWRWSQHGINTPLGTIKLEVASLAGRKVTSSEALDRFLNSVHRAKENLPSEPTKGSTAKAKAAKAALDQLGL